MFQEDECEIDELGWQADLQTEVEEKVREEFCPIEILFQDKSENDFLKISADFGNLCDYIIVNDFQCILPWNNYTEKLFRFHPIEIYHTKKHNYILLQEPGEIFLSDLSEQYLQTINKQWLKDKIEFYYRTYSSIFDTHSLKKEHDEIFGIYVSKYNKFIRKSWELFPARANFAYKTITKFLRKDQIWKNKESNNIYYISKLGITESSWEHQNYYQNKDIVKFYKDQYVILEPYRDTSPSKVLKEFDFSEWIYFGANYE